MTVHCAWSVIKLKLSCENLWNCFPPTVNYGERNSCRNFLSLWMESCDDAIHIKPLLQYFCMALFVFLCFSKKNLGFLSDRSEETE